MKQKEPKEIILGNGRKFLTSPLTGSRAMKYASVIMELIIKPFTSIVAAMSEKDLNSKEIQKLLTGKQSDKKPVDLLTLESGILALTGALGDGRVIEFITGKTEGPFNNCNGGFFENTKVYDSDIPGNWREIDFDSDFAGDIESAVELTVKLMLENYPRFFGLLVESGKSLLGSFGSAKQKEEMKKDANLPPT